MRFNLVDRVVELEASRRIACLKNLTLAEEYLAEHFPGFPVLPGVLMLEAISQAGAWLIRVTEGFTHSVTLLKEARNVKYGQFVAPGRQLFVALDWLGDDGRETTFKATGTVDGRTSVSAKVTLKRFNLSERSPLYAKLDERLRREQREVFEMLAPVALREKLGLAAVG